MTNAWVRFHLRLDQCLRGQGPRATDVCCCMIGSSGFDVILTQLAAACEPEPPLPDLLRLPGLKMLVFLFSFPPGLG